MQTTPEHHAAPEEPEDFDQVLRALARPVDVVPGIEAKLAHAGDHPLESQVEKALRDASPQREPRPGDVLDGRYRIARVLGRGGMGVVLEAEQLRTQKRVAIKWMSAARGEERSAAQVARFLREARAVANIQHNNVVGLYDVGDNAGVPFLVLELLHGESLRARLMRGVMGLDEVELVLHGVLSGVAAVHRSGVVHRDLKPDNIFLCRDNGDPIRQNASPIIAKVLDFGVAAMRVTTQDGLGSLTRTGALLGTPTYMALEQLTGGEVDARADIYALGVMLYEMLTGRLPFEARSAPELAVQMATQEPTPPSKFVPALPRALEALILRALSRTPEARFPDVNAFALALSESARPTRRKPIVIALSVALAAATVCFTAAWRAPADVPHMHNALPQTQVTHARPVRAPHQEQAASSQGLAQPVAQQPVAPPVTEAVPDSAAHPAPTSKPAVTRRARVDAGPHAPRAQHRREPASSAAPVDETEIHLEDF